jgi:FixJ family two-component response regulator
MPWRRDKPLIAVVDDDVFVRRALTALLTAMGFHVDTFSSGGEFVHRLHETASFNPGCVILDVCMPGLNGIEVLKHVARARPRVPVILLTGAYDRRTLEAARASGPFAVLEKPPDAGLLKKTIHAALGTGQPEGPGDNVLRSVGS